MAENDDNEKQNKPSRLGPYGNAEQRLVYMHSRQFVRERAYVRSERLILARPMEALPKT